jgi:hypothetical protein
VDEPSLSKKEIERNGRKIEGKVTEMTRIVEMRCKGNGDEGFH